ncbi:Uncharacterized protein M6B38_229130 [Iris pallida]|uniref:Uncharacterized protein n=1 Tax=Iris pallida TaxID=29817 RepID=A0AAX6DU55_IRIPA|nr:Uncharacterized protein M6B38_229130 [Iris pallida]
MVEAEKRGLSFDKLLTIPEQDDWTYSDGHQPLVLLTFFKCTSMQGSLIQLPAPYKLQSSLILWCEEGEKKLICRMRRSTCTV